MDIDNSVSSETSFARGMELSSVLLRVCRIRELTFQEAGGAPQRQKLKFLQVSRVLKEFKPSLGKHSDCIPRIVLPSS